MKHKLHEYRQRRRTWRWPWRSRLWLSSHYCTGRRTWRTYKGRYRDWFWRRLCIRVCVWVPFRNWVRQMVRLDGLLHRSLKWYLSIAIVMIVITIVWIAVENLIHQINHITNDGTFIKTIHKMLNSKNIRITLFFFVLYLFCGWGSLFSHLIKVRMLHTLFSCQAYVVVVLHHFSQ